MIMFLTYYDCHLLLHAGFQLPSLALEGDTGQYTQISVIDERCLMLCH